jgi:hypothetical protein
MAAVLGKDEALNVEELERQEAALAVPESGDTGEGGKLKMIISLVKKCFGVKDIAAVYVPAPAPACSG